MKITKKQLKALIREQVAAVVNETDWRDVSDPDYHKPQGESGPYADEMKDLLRRIMDPGEMSFDQAMDEFGDLMKKYTSAEPEVDDVEWMEDRFHDDQEGPGWPEEEEEVDPWEEYPDPEAFDVDKDDLYSGPEDPEGRVPGQPKEPEEEEGALRLKTPTRQSIDNLKRRLRLGLKKTPEEPEEKKYGHVYWDENEGKNKVHLKREGRIKESELKDMIRAILEEESELLEKKKKKKSKAKRTAKGNVTQAAREKHATVGKDKFPIFDKKSAEAAIDLRGHTSKKNQKKIINKAAKYAPAAAKKAREVEKNK